MSAIEVVIHGTGSGVCSLTGKEGEGLTVTFKDGTLSEGFLSHRAFVQLVKMKCGKQAAEPEYKPRVANERTAAVSVNGNE